MFEGKCFVIKVKTHHKIRTTTTPKAKGIKIGVYLYFWGVSGNNYVNQRLVI